MNGKALYWVTDYLQIGYEGSDTVSESPTDAASVEHSPSDDLQLRGGWRRRWRPSAAAIAKDTPAMVDEPSADEPLTWNLRANEFLVAFESGEPGTPPNPLSDELRERRRQGRIFAAVCAWLKRRA
jgi:hypothetical protein